MANIKSSAKRVLVSRVRAERNKADKSELKTTIKKFEENYSASAFILEAMLDFLRAALFLWSRPLDTARSTNLTATL